MNHCEEDIPLCAAGTNPSNSVRLQQKTTKEVTGQIRMHLTRGSSL